MRACEDRRCEKTTRKRCEYEHQPEQEHRSDSGILATELAVLLPFVLVIALVAVALGQAIRHDSAAQAAADAAARVASLSANDHSHAENLALQAAGQVCRGGVSVDFDWSVPALGDDTAVRPGTVAVSVSCTRELGGLGLLGRSQTRTSSARAVSVIEFFRTDT